MTPKRREKFQRYIAEASPDDLREISEMINGRYRRMRLVARRQALESFVVGDEAILDNIKPKYMVGTKVRVTNISGTQFAVRVVGEVDPRGMTRFGGSFRVPANCLVRVN